MVVEGIINQLFGDLVELDHVDGLVGIEMSHCIDAHLLNIGIVQNCARSIDCVLNSPVFLAFTMSVEEV